MKARLAQAQNSDVAYKSRVCWIGNNAEPSITSSNTSPTIPRIPERMEVIKTLEIIIAITSAVIGSVVAHFEGLAKTNEIGLITNPSEDLGRGW